MPTEDDDAASVDFSRWQACRPLSTEGIIAESDKDCTLEGTVFSETALVFPGKSTTIKSETQRGKDERG